MKTRERDHERFPSDENGDVLWEFFTKGDPLTEPREIDFSCVFASEEAALDFAVSCLRSGFKVELTELAVEERPGDGLDWEVFVYTDAIPTHSEISKIEEALGKHAAEVGGRFSGWSAIFLGP